MKDGINITLTRREIGIATAGVKSRSLFKNLEDTGISYAEAELCLAKLMIILQGLEKDEPLSDIPDYETLEEYKRRTGKDFPDDGLVWVKDGVTDEEGWRADYFQNAMDDRREFIVCVNGPLPPPNDWRPNGTSS